MKARLEQIASVPDDENCYFCEIEKKESNQYKKKC